MKSAFRLRSRVAELGRARLLFTLHVLAAALSFPVGCGTNAGNPFVESDDGDSSNFSGSPNIENPSPETRTEHPQGSGGGIVVAKNEVGPQPSAGPIAETTPPSTTENSGTNPAASQGTGAVPGAQSQQTAGSGNPPQEGGEIGTAGTPGAGAIPIRGISKSAAEIVAEVNLSSKACKLINLSNEALSAAFPVVRTDASGSAKGTTVSLLMPVISVSLGENFKSGSIPVLVTAESTVLENASTLPSLKNYTVAVYQSNTLICVYRANIDVSLINVSQVNIVLRNPN